MNIFKEEQVTHDQDGIKCSYVGTVEAHAVFHVQIRENDANGLRSMSLINTNSAPREEMDLVNRSCRTVSELLEVARLEEEKLNDKTDLSKYF